MIPPGSVSNQLISVQDLMATLAALTGYDLPANQALDSVSFLPELLGQEEDPDSGRIHLIMEARERWDDKLNHNVNVDPHFALREGPWKLILDEYEVAGLYNLDEDLAESTNLMNDPAYADRIERMHTLLLQRYDIDRDGIPDDADNCILDANGPLIPDAGGNIQLDTDGDGYGNICDPDLDNDGVVNAADLAILKERFFTTDPDADLNGDGSVNGGDLAILKSFFFQPPGPSGNTPPVADAGVDQKGKINSVITLDGSGSSDIDGDTLTYTWSLASRPTGSVATLAGTDTESPTLIPDVGGLYVVSLIVNDGRVLSGRHAPL